MYTSQGTWDEYTHLEAPEAEQTFGTARATGVFTNDDDEGNALLVEARDEEPEHNPHHTRHVLARRPLVEMLRDARHEQDRWATLTPEQQRSAVFWDTRTRDWCQGPRQTRERRHG